MTKTEASMSDCVFCDAAPISRLIVELGTCRAQWDAYPATPGHVLIIPKRHVDSVFELTDQERVDMASLLLYVPSWSPADGYTIGINEGQAAGRTVDHVHQHVIPRRHGDVPKPHGGVRLATPNHGFGEWAARLAHKTGSPA